MDFAALSFFWFGMVSALLALIFIVSLASRSYFWAAAFAVIFIVFSEFTMWPASTYVLANWPTLLVYAGIYLAFGAAWAVFAWVLYLHKMRNQYRERREALLPRFLHDTGSTAFDPEDKVQVALFGKFMASHSHFDSQLTLSKATLAEQILFWPIKIVAFFIGDFIRVFVDVFVGLFGGVFKKIKIYMFREFPELSGK